MHAPVPSSDPRQAGSTAAARVSPDSLILVADIGGTNIRMALAQGVELRRETIRRYATAGFDGPGAVIAAFLGALGGRLPDAAVIAVAGTVHHGRAQTTNLEWDVNLADLQSATGIETIILMNDLQAQGHALSQLPRTCLAPVLPGRAAPPDATRLAIGLGTGFNACPVHQPGGHALVPPAEYGQTDLPVRTAQELALARALACGRPGARVEDLLSGPGIARAHAALGGEENVDPARIVASAGHDPAARQTLEVFVRLLGRVVADLALTHLPFGGIFLVGGVSRAIAPFLTPMGFSDHFKNRGQFSDFMDNFPVSLVQDDTAALLGCARAIVG